MRLSVTVAAIATLLASFLEAPYFHLHNNPESEHVRRHHHGHAAAVHSHFAVPTHRQYGAPVVQSSDESAGRDAIFLAQASRLTPLSPFPHFFVVETSDFRIDRVEGEFVWAPAHHAHDPPGAAAASPRAPPA